MMKVHSEEQFRSIIADVKPIVAVFKADWCKDCHFIEPFMPELEDHYKQNLTFYHIDRDELPELCSELNILGIPSFIVFKQGREIDRFVSKLRKTKEEIEQFLDQALTLSNSHN
jgi:thioredoxin-like negative regulator of GroEL